MELTHITWNGEKIQVWDHPMGICAVLDNYDPTPWDFETPARGPHSKVGVGNSEYEAITDLIQQIID